MRLATLFLAFLFPCFLGSAKAQTLSPTAGVSPSPVLRNDLERGIGAILKDAHITSYAEAELAARRSAFSIYRPR